MRGVALFALCWAVCAAAGRPETDMDSAHDTPLKCSRYCTEDRRLGYQTGQSYIYEYHADTTSGVTDADHRESRLHLSATAEISVMSPCDFVLQLRDVQLEDSRPEDAGAHQPVPEHAQFAEALSKHALSFSYHDGKVSELCPSAGDEPWILNIKRGVLSAFQTNLEDGLVYERDVAGVCETEYELSRPTFPLVVRRSKDLMACTDRQHHFLSLQSVSYNSPVDANSLPLIRSSHECKQNFGPKGFLERAICIETHLFRPFSNEGNGAATRVVQSLIYKQNTAMTTATQLDVSGRPLSRTTLLYQHPDEQEATVTSPDQVALNILEALSAKTADGVKSDVPRLFSQLVTTLRSLSYPKLAKIFSTLLNSPKRKFLLDAMPMVGTPDGMTVMVDLYKSKEISDFELDAWLTTLAFEKKPTRNMLAALSSLLDKNPRKQAILGVTSLVHTYCRGHTSCQNDFVVRDVMGKVERLLGAACTAKNDAHAQLIIVALKGIGNAGVVVGSVDTLHRCYTEEKNVIDIRLAAVDAFRRLPCGDAPRRQLLDAFTNVKHDTELRIAAYLATMTCPDSRTLRLVKESLYNEDVNQVASFVWTHLTNMQETSTRWKQGIKDLLSNEFLRNKFNTDVRKFSRNYEASTYFDSLNAGAAVESNIIFSPKSYLPRSANLNLTIDLFGESFNVFEVGGRAEGFESAVEDVFGPQGYFPDQSVKKFMENFRGKAEQELENSIDELASTFDAKENLKQDPQASVYGRIFGNELLYSRFNGLQNEMEIVGNKSYRDHLLKFLKGENIDYMKSFSIIDASYVIPTVVGFPLEFAVNGSATVSLKTKGSVNLKRDSISVVGEVAPSAAVEMTGTMTMNAFVTKTGVVSVNRLHTNTYLGGTLRIAQGKLVEVKLNVPREKMEVLDVSSELFVLHRDVPVALEGIVKDREETQGCSPDFLSKVVGMKVCGQLSYPNASLVETAPYFPLTGPFKLQLSLVKTDTFNAYEFSYKVQNAATSNPKINSVSVHFDTPGSTIDRRVQVFGMYDRKKSAVTVSLRTPFVGLAATGMLASNAEGTRIEASLSVNDAEVVEVRAGVKQTFVGRGGTYEPFALLSYNGGPVLDLSGKIYFLTGIKYSADLSLKAPFEPILISGNLNIQNDGYVLNGSMKSAVINGTVEGAMRKVSDYVSSHGRVQYALLDGKDQTIEFTNKMLVSTQGDAQLKNVQLTVKMSEYAAYNLDAKWELRRGVGLFSHSLGWTLGKSDWQTEQLLRYKTLRGHVDYQLMASLLSKHRGVDYKIDAKHQTTATSLTTHAIAHLGATHRYVASVECVQHHGGDLGLDVEFSYPGFNATLGGALSQTEPRHYEGHLEARLDVSPVGSRRKRVRSVRLAGTLVENSSDYKIDQAFSVKLSGELQAELSGAHIISDNSATQWMKIKAAGMTLREDVHYSFDNAHNFDVTLALGQKQYRGSAVIVDTDKETSISVQLDFSTRIALVAKLLSDNGVIFKTLEMKLALNEHINPSNKVYFVVKAEEMKSNIVLEYPGERITGEIDSTSPGSTKVTISWGAGQKIAALLEWAATQREGHVTLRVDTPFQGIESQHISGRYSLSATQAEVQGELVWQEELIAMTIIGASEDLGLKSDLRLTSTVSDMTVHLHHTHHPGQLASSARVAWGRDNVALSVGWTVNASNVAADLRLTSTQQLVPSIQGQLRYKSAAISDTGYLEFTWADEKKITGNLVLHREPRLSTLVQLTTPFEGYETLALELLYKLDSSNLQLESYAGFNEKIIKMTIQGSSSDTSIEGTGNIVTPFTKALQIGFSHSRQSNNFKDGLVIQYGGKQVLNAKSDICLYSLDNNNWISILASIPGNSLKFNYKNKMDAKNELVSIGGTWNSKTLSFDIVDKVTETSNSYSVHYRYALRGTVFDKDYAVDFYHHLTPKQRRTVLEIPGNISIMNILQTDDIYNWENKFTVQTPVKSGSIINILNFNAENQEWKHKMTVEVGEKTATAQISAKMFHYTILIREAHAEISTPWGDPVKLQFTLSMEESTIEPEIILQYKRDREIRIKGRVQLGLIKSEVGFEMAAPYMDPIIIKAMYDHSKSTQEALVMAEWDSVAVELKASVNLNIQSGSAHVTLTRSDKQTELLKVGLQYDIQGAEKLARFEGKFIDKQLLVAMSAAKDQNTYSLNTEVHTPFNGWETIMLETFVDISQPVKFRSTLIVKEQHKIQFTGDVFLNTNSSGLNLAFISTFSKIPTVSLAAVYDRRSSNSHVFETELNFNGGKSELHIKLEHDDKNFTDGGMAEISLKTPLKSLEKLNISFNYHNTKGHQQIMLFFIEKNDWILKINGQSSFSSSGGNADITLQLPFRDLPHISASLKHIRVSNGEHTLKIVLSYNNKSIEIDNAVFSSINELVATIQINTPIAGYEKLKTEFNVAGIIKQEKSLLIVLLTQKHNFRLSGSLNFESLLAADGNINVSIPFSNYKNVNTGFRYDLKGLNFNKRYANTYLEYSSSKHEINFNVDTHQENKATAELSITSPIVNNIRISGDYNLSQDAFVVSTRVTTGDRDQVFSADVVIRESMLSVQLICPFLGYSQLSLSGTYNFNTVLKSATFNVVKNNIKLVNIIATATLQSLFVTEFQVEVQTPIQNWERIAIHSKYNLIEGGDELVKLVAMKGEHAFEVAGSWTRDKNQEHGSLQVLLSTLGSVDMTVHHSPSEECSVTLTAQRMDGERLLNSSFIIAEKSASLFIQTPFKQLQIFNFSGTFDIASNMKYANLGLEYQGIGSEKAPFKINLLADINRTILKMFSIPISPFFEEMTASFGYRNIFKDPTNSLLSFSLTVNRSKVIKATANLALDWKNKIGIDLKIHSRIDGNKKFNLFAWSEPKFPPNRVQLAVKYNMRTLVDFKSDATNFRNGGFSYYLEVAPGFTRSDVRTTLAIEFYPQEMRISAKANLTGNGIRDKYSAGLTFIEPSNHLQVYISTPIKGYENLFFTWKHSYDSIESELKTPFTDYKHIKINGKLNIMQSNQKMVTFLVTQNEEVAGIEMMFHYGGNYAETSLTLRIPFESTQVIKFISQYDMRGPKKMAFVRLDNNGDVYKMDSEVLVGNLRADGQLHVFTPMADMKKLHLQVAFDLEQTSSKTITISGEVNHVKQVELRFELHHIAERHHLLLELHSPVSDTAISFEAAYDLSAGVHSAEAHAALLGIIGNVSASVDTYFTRGAISARMVRGDIPNMAQLSWNIQLQGKTKLAEVIVELPSRQKTSLMATMTIDGPTTLGASLTYTSLLSEIYVFNAQWDSAQAKMLKGLLDVQWGKIKIIHLETTIQLSTSERPLIFNAYLSSSFKPLEKITLTYETNFTSECTVNLNSCKANHKISFLAPFIKLLNISMDHNLNFPNHTLNATFIYGSSRVQIGTQFIAYANPEISIEIKTPFNGLSHLQFNGKLPSRQLMKGIELLFILEDHIVKFKAEVNSSTIDVFFTTSMEFIQKIALQLSLNSAMLDAQWNKTQYISAKVNYLHSTLLKLDCNTSFNGYERILGDLTRETDTNISARLLWGNQKLELHRHATNATTYEMILATPWTKNSKVQIVHEDKDGLLYNVKLYYGEDTYKMDVKLVRDIKNPELSFKLESSLDTVGDITFNTVMYSNDTNQEAHLKFKIGTFQFHAFGYAMRKEPQINFGLQFVTPIQSMKKIEAELNVNYIQGSGFFITRRNNNIYEIRYGSRVNTEHVNAWVFINVDHFHISNSTIDLKFETNSVHWIINILGQNFVFKGLYMIKQSVVSVETMLSIPFVKSVNNASLSVTVDPIQYTASVKGQWDVDKEVWIRVSVLPEDLLFNIQTPYAGIHDITVAAKLISSQGSHDLTSSAHFEDYNVTMHCVLRTIPDDCSIDTQLQWSKMGKLSLTGSLKAAKIHNFTNIQGQLRLKTSVQQFDHFDIKFNSQLINEGKTAYNLELLTPFTFLPKLQSSLTLHKEEDQDISVHFITSLLEKVFSVTASLRRPFAGDLLATINAEFPLGNTTTPWFIEGILSCGQWHHCASHLQLQWSETLHEVTGTYTVTEQGLDAQIGLHTPTINSNISFGASIKRTDNCQADAEVYVGKNKMFASYNLGVTSFSGRLALNVPTLKLPETGFSLSGEVYGVSNSQGVFTYKYGKHTGKVEIKFESEDRGSTLAFVKLDLPVFFGKNPQALQFEINFGKPSLFIEGQYNTGKSSFVASLKFENDTKAMGVVAQITHPRFGEKKAMLVIKNNWELIKFQLTDIISVELKMKSDSGFVTLSHRNKQHTLQYYIHFTDGFEGNVQMESPLLLDEKVVIIVAYRNKGDHLQGKMNFQSGLHLNSASLDLRMGDQKTASVEVVADSRILLAFDSSSSVTKSNVQAEASLEVFGSVTNIALRHHRGFPLDSEINVMSPLLPHMTARAILNTENDSLLAYAGHGNISNGEYIMMEAGVKSDIGKVYFDLKTPVFSVIKHFSFAGGFKRESEGSFTASLESQFASHFVDSLEVASNFHLTLNTVDVSLKIKTPVKDHEIYEGSIHIPLKFRKNSNMNISLTLPCNHYSFYTSLALESYLEFELLAKYNNKHIDAKFHVEYFPKMSLVAEINTPFKGLNHYNVNLKGQRNVQDGKDVINYIEWNDKRIELRYTFMMEMNKFLTRVELSTPFHGFDHYSMRVQYENDAHKVAVATLNYSGLERDIGVEFDYLFNGIFDINLIMKLNIPFLPKIGTAALLLTNNLDMNEGSYKGMISGKFNEKESSLAVEGIMNLEEMTLEIAANMNDKKIYLQVLNGLRDNKHLLSCELRTPFPIVHHAKTFIQYSPHEFQAGFIYNSNKIIDLYVNSSKITWSLTFKNPIQPVALSYSADFEDKISFNAEICWDLNHRLQSQFGIGATLSKTGFSSEIKLPTRILSFIAVSEHTFQRTEYSMHFSWEEGKKIGYQLLRDSKTRDNSLILRTLARIDFPFRSFESVFSLTSDFQFNIVESIELFWDAADDRSKKVGLHIGKHNSSTQLTIQHALLDHDIIVRCTPISKSLDTFGGRLHIIYSSNPEDEIILGAHLTYVTKLPHSFSTGISVYHKTSKLGLEANVEGFHGADGSSGKLNISYLESSSGQHKVLSALGRVNYIQPEIDLTVQTVENHLEARGSLWKKRNGYSGITFEVMMNQKAPLTAEVTFGMEDTSVELALGYGTARQYHARGQFPHWQEVTTEVWHMLNGVRMQDGLATVRLNTTRLLWTAVSWQPCFFDDIQRAVLQEYTDIALVMDVIAQDYLDFLNEDFLKTFETFYTSFTLKDFATYSKNELNNIMNDFHAIGVDLADMYKRNNFFIKDLHTIILSIVPNLEDLIVSLNRQLVRAGETVYQVIKNFISMLWDVLSLDSIAAHITEVWNGIKNLTQKAVVYATAAFKHLDYLRQVVAKSAKKILEYSRWQLFLTKELFINASAKLDVVFQSVLDGLEEFTEPFISKLEEYLMTVHDIVVDMELNIIVLIDTIADTLLSVKEVRELLQVLGDYATWLEEFHLQEYVDVLIDMAAEAMELLVSDITKALRDLKNHISKLSKPFVGQVDQMPVLVSIKSSISTIYQKVAWLWHYHRISHYLLEGADYVLNQADDIMLNIIDRLDTDSTDDTKANLVFRPDLGYIEYAHPLPFEWNGFNELPKIEQLNISPLNKKSDDYIAKLDSYSYFFMHPINSALNKSLVPPFTKQAVIAGGHHFITFDGRMYDFEGNECSYLLASDFLNRKFSVVINYELQDSKVVKRSLTVIAEGHHIDIGTSGWVTVDGKATELPIKVGTSIMVTRLGSRVALNSKLGLNVECNLLHDVCTLELSGWHFGKTGGLLGTFDNEPSNDLSLPDSSITPNIAFFTRSWRVGSGSNCRSTPNSVQQDGIVTDQSNICRAYFQSDRSPLEPCFASIKPQLYHDMCLRGSNSSCLAALAYVAQCKKEGIEIWAPNDCVMCLQDDGTILHGGEDRVLEYTPSLADVVLVVEQGSCLKGAQITNAVAKLDTTMTEKGVVSTRFSVVSFAGTKFHQPHTHTVDGQIWTSRKGIEKAIHSLEFDEDTDADDSVLDALHFAVQLPFRGGASRTIILLTCEKCDQLANDSDIQKMLNELKDTDITLHVLGPDAVRHDKTGRLYGMDTTGTYSGRNLKSMMPSKILLKQASVSKSLCMPLALGTNGTIFNLNPLMVASSSSRKFTDVWARRVALTALPEKCQKCECVPRSDHVGQLECIPCDNIDQLGDQFTSQEWETILSNDEDEDDGLQF